MDTVISYAPPEQLPVGERLPFVELIWVTTEPDSQVPVNCGVVSLVTLSVFELPVSLPADRSGMPGCPGAVVSMVTPNTPDGGLVPFTLLAVAVMLWVVWVSVLVRVML